jgi:hypothetical protein
MYSLIMGRRGLTRVEVCDFKNIKVNLITIVCIYWLKVDKRIYTLDVPTRRHISQDFKDKATCTVKKKLLVSFCVKRWVLQLEHTRDAIRMYRVRILAAQTCCP